jgi:endogenous inhibitor of DNA gyrase (YacG/DUF329 family)
MRHKHITSACKYCNKPYLQTRGNKVFCSTSCRVGNWKLKNKYPLANKTQLSETRKTEEKVIGHIGDIAKTGIAIAITEGIKKLNKTSNSDIIKSLEIIVKNQHIIWEKLKKMGS